MRLCNVSFLLCCVFLGYTYISYEVIAKPVEKGSYGPFVIRIVSVYECDKPSRPYESDPTASFHAELYNTTRKSNLLRGNVTILRDNRNMKANLRNFYLEDDKWQLSFQISRMGCRALVISLLVSALGIKFNKKSCSIPKGFYSFDNIDYNQIDHMWAMTREYGVILWRMEVQSQYGTVLCWESITEVTPAPHNKTKA